jgi:pyruvate,water dikinase
MDTKAAPVGFPLPSDLPTLKGAEQWASMYPYYTRFRPEDDGRFWFYNGMHFPEPMPAFDVITAEAPYVSLGAYNSRVFAIPPVLGIDHRIVNGRVYISVQPVTDPAKIEERAKLFQDRAFFYFGNWDKLYAQWKEKMLALIADIDALKVPDLPEYEEDAMVKEARGIAQNFRLVETFHRCTEAYLKMWQYHFEFLVLGYGAYLTFFEFCKKAFPEITDQTVSRMVAGVDVLMFRPDDELKPSASASTTRSARAAPRPNSSPRCTRGARRARSGSRRSMRRATPGSTPQRATASTTTTAAGTTTCRCRSPRCRATSRRSRRA